MFVSSLTKTKYMKKITFLVACFVATTSFMNAQKVQLPAAYFNNSATTQGENAGVANEGERNTDVIVPFTGTYYNGKAPNAMVYDNGPYFNVPGTPNVSLLESSLGMNTLGAGAQFTAGNSVADDVVLTGDFNITSMDVFAYQTGTAAPSITAIYVQVWDGDPSGGGANVIWGDLSTDVLEDAVSAETLRYSESSPGDTSRQLTRVTASTPGLTLTAGTYWIEWTFEGSGSSGPWAPPIVILGETTTGNAVQNQNGMWVALEDGGTLTPQGLPFILYGTEILGVEDNTLAGFKFYPNPTSDVLKISAAKNIESISVFNVLGQKVMTTTIGATSSNLNVSSLAAGTYMMNVTVEGKTGTYKFVKN